MVGNMETYLADIKKSRHESITATEILRKFHTCHSGNLKYMGPSIRLSDICQSYREINGEGLA